MRSFFVFIAALQIVACGNAPSAQTPAVQSSVSSRAPVEPIVWPLLPGTPREYVQLYVHTEPSATDRTRMVVDSAEHKNEPLVRYVDVRGGDWTVEILDGAGTAVCTRHMRSPGSYNEGVPDEVPNGAPFVDHGVAFDLRCPVPKNAKTIRITGPSKSLSSRDPRRTSDDNAIVVIGTATYPRVTSPDR